MTAAEKIEQRLYDARIDVTDFNFYDGFGGCVIEDESGRKHIGIEKGLPQSQRKVCLAHEAGHCLYGGLYSTSTPLLYRQKAERKAFKWAALHLASPAEIKKAARSLHLHEEWELAEYFDIPPKEMHKIMMLYQEAGAI